MSRVSYADDYDVYSILARGRWEINSERALNGKKGQRILREILAALDALPTKELTATNVFSLDGETFEPQVCVLGAWAWHKGLDTEKLGRFNEADCHELQWFLDGHKETRISYTLAWELMEKNDERFSHATPAERYQRMREWIESRITGDA